MQRNPPLARIGIVNYPGAQRAAVHGLSDLFETAAQLDVERGAALPRLEVVVFTRRRLANAEPLAAVILPPSLVGTPNPRVAAPFLPWLMARHAQGSVLCSVCAGAFLLAETGLLDDRPATTHWVLADAFSQRFPRVQLDTAKLLVDDGTILTGGGVMAWIDLGLRLIERLLGPAVMLATARMFLVDPAGREQRYYASPTPRVGHGDEAILGVQQWLLTHSQGRITMAALARRAGLGERTFLRRFLAATGQTPSAYLQQLRVERARELLELTRLAIDDVAWKVGYSDVSAFRKIFLRIVGLSPGAYRQRFSASARRAR